MSQWLPDVCPDQSAPCRILTVGGAGGAFVRFEGKCAFHAKSKVPDRDLYAAIVDFNSQREVSRGAAKASLNLDKEHPGVPYRMEPDGSYTLGVDQKGALMPEWPTDPKEIAKVRADIDAALATKTRR